MLVVNCELEELKDYQSNLEKIYSNAKYLILNTDINKEEFEPNKHIQIITYGLNHKSTVTISSISDTDILIYLQRNIKNISNSIIEVEEKRIKIKEKSAKNGTFFLKKIAKIVEKKQ